MTDANFNIKSLTIPELREYIANLISRQAALKQAAEEAQDELASRVSNEAAALFAKAGKTSGDITFEADGVKLKASVSKSVKWDNAKLQAVAASMDWDTAQRIFKISFDVPEATFKAIPDPELVAKLTEARTVKYGELTIKPI